jgi:dolichol-phosphate mannosyltransferase
VFKGQRIIAIAPVFNEEKKIGEVVRRVPRDVVDEILVVDDGSTDSSVQVAESGGATTISLGATIGVGAAIREGYRYAKDGGYDIAVVMAGNNKDHPEEIPLLLDPIVEGGADLVQGSRWLGEVGDLGEMPLYRRVATRIHPALFNLITRARMTDTTNGFRAASAELIGDPRLELDQTWLDEYELEVYLLYKTWKLGYKVVEVPVNKTYPAKDLGQTKMKPITGWWSILRPLVLLGLRLKR